MTGKFPSLLDKCILWWPGDHVAVTNTAKTITANGNATQVTTVTDPWGLARPVGYFDGNGDYLTCGAAADASWMLGSTWTIEGYFYPTTSGTQLCICGNNAAYFTIFIAQSGFGNMVYLVRDSVGTMINAGVQYGTGNYNLNQWNHVVITRNGNAAGSKIRGWLNGVLDYEYTIGTTVLYTPADAFGFGRYNGGSYFNGYLSEFRVLSSTVDLGATYTVPTTRFKPDAYTKLLLHMYGSGATFVDDPFIDVNEFPIIPSGVAVTPNGTFYKDDLGNNKSVVKFDGSTNYISLTDSTSWDLFEADFTISGWVRSTNAPMIPICGQMSSSNTYWLLWVHDIELCIVLAGKNDGLATFRYISDVLTISSNTWYHITVVKSGSSCIMYVDGINKNAVATTAWSGIVDVSNPLTIGLTQGAGIDRYHTGNLKDLMIFKGRALTEPEIKLLMARTHPTSGLGLLPGGYDYYKDV